jgi:hypothetical protein
MADETHRDFERVEGGRIEVWLREDGMFGVSLLPDEGKADNAAGGRSYTSAEGLSDFPETYDAEALKAWGRKRWPDGLGHE